MTVTNHILTLKVSGTSADGAPAFSLYVNGVQTAANVAVTADFHSGQWQTLTYDYSSDQASDAIQIVYNNDYSDPTTGADRNLYVESLTLDGSTFQAALAKGAATASANNSSTAAVLYTNGALSFASTDFKASTSTGPLSYMGVNYASAQYPSQSLTAWNQLSTYPTTDSIDYFASKGLNILRLPILWERVQPVKDGPLDASQLSQIQAVVSYAATKGMTVIIDPHNFGSAYGGVIGESSTTNADFANFWGKLAGALKGNSNVMFGLMNEPHVQTATDWLGSVNAAIAGIRAAGATSQKILVPGIGWDGGEGWLLNGNASIIGQGVVDPSDNYAFEVHQYLDSDTTGTHNSVVSASIGVERLQAVTQWAETNNQKLFLGEIGVGTDTASLTALDNTLAFMKAHSDAWLGASYWEAGSPSQFFSIDPVNGVDRPQMAVLQKYAPGTASSAAGATATSYTANGVTSFADGSTETKTYASNGTLTRDVLVHADGSRDVTTSAITGQSYTTEHDSFNAAGVQTGILRTHADGSLAYLYAYDAATGQKATNQYSVAGLITTRTIVGADGANETITYASDGSTVLRDTQIHADRSTDVYQSAITGQSYTAEHDVTNAAGVTTSIIRTHADGTLAYGYSYDPVTGLKTTSQYTTAGLLAARTAIAVDGSSEATSYAADGTTLLKDTQVHAGGARDIYVYGITGSSYTTEHDIYDAKGNQTGIVRTHADGTMASSYAYDPATRTTINTAYSAAGLMTTQSAAFGDGSTDTKTYASDGVTVLRDVQVHADKSKDNVIAGITGQAYTAEHDVYDAQGNQTSIVRTHADGTMASSYAYNPASHTTTNTAYTAAGLMTAQATTFGDGSTDTKTFAGDGTTVLRDVQVHADKSQDVAMVGITGQAYTAEHDVYDAQGNQTSIVRTHADGTLAYTFGFTPATGVKVVKIYSGIGVLVTQSTLTKDGVTDTKTFGADGKTLIRQSTVTAANVCTYFYAADQATINGIVPATPPTPVAPPAPVTPPAATPPTSTTPPAVGASSPPAPVRTTQTLPDGSKTVSITGITGTGYVTEQDSYDSKGNQTSIVRAHADGTPAFSFTFDPASGTKVTKQYSATGLLMTQSTITADMAVDTKTYGSDGVTLVRDNQAHADGTKDVYAYGITGASYTAEHDVFDQQGNQVAITRTHADGTLAYTSTTDAVSHARMTSQYTAAGLLAATGTTYADGTTDTKTYGSDGLTLLRDVQSHLDGSKDVYQPNITGKSFVAEHDRIDSSGRLAWSDMTNLDGSHSQTAYAAGQTLVSTAGVADAMTSFGSDMIRLFAGSGQDTVTGFHPGGGATHDTLALSTSVATSLAGLQQNGMITASGQDSLIHLNGSDSILLRGVAPGALTTANFTFS